MKKFYFLLILLFLGSCILDNNENNDDDSGDDTTPTYSFNVLKTVKSYDSNNSLIGTTNFTMNGMSLTYKLVDSVYASVKMTYNDVGNVIKYIYYDDSGQQLSRSITSYQILTGDIYVLRTVKTYDSNNSLTSTLSYTKNGMDVSYSISGYTYRSTYDTNGNIIETYSSDASGQQLYRSTTSYQLLTGDIYVPQTVKSYDSNNSLIGTTNYTKNNMSITYKMEGATYASGKITYNSNGNIIESIYYDCTTGSQSMRIVNTWQIMTSS